MRVGADSVVDAQLGLVGVGCMVLHLMGLRLRTSLTSLTWLNRTGSCTAGLTVMWPMVDAAGFCTLPWVVPDPPCSPASSVSHRLAFRSLVSSCFSISIPLSSLLTPGPLLSCCLTVVIALFESVAVAEVVVMVGSWVGGAADVATTWHAFAMRSSRSIVS